MKAAKMTVKLRLLEMLEQMAGSLYVMGKFLSA